MKKTIAEIKDQIGKTKHMIDINQDNYEEAEAEPEISYYISKIERLERRLGELEVALRDAEAAPEVEAAPVAEAAPEVETVLEATSYFGGSARVKITETGYEVLHDDRRHQDGYLHICDDSADRVTDACRDQILRYLYMSKPDHQGKRLPSLGATPQHQYFRGLSLQEREAIGNGGKSCCYTRPTWHSEA